MLINGIEISEIKDAQDILTALEIIKGGIENLSNSMNENYINYSSLSEDMDRSANSQKELIESINNLQINARTIVNNINTLNNNTETINNNTINTIKKEFRNFDMQIKDTMSSVINGIDLYTFRNQVETLFNDKIYDLENEVEKLKSCNYDLNELNDTIKTSLKTVKDETNDSINELNDTIETSLKNTKTKMDDSIKDFNRLAKVINWKVIVSVLFGGMFIGALLMMFFGLNIAKSKVYRDEQIAMSDYKEKTEKMESKYIAASELEKVAREYEIEYTTDENGNRFITIPDNRVEKVYKSNTDYQVWKLY